MQINNSADKNIRSAIVILGASGDLAQRKLIPALAELFKKGNINSSSVIIGSGRSDFSCENFRKRFNVTDQLAKLLYYYKGISGLKKYISDLGSFQKIIFFMALPPAVYAKYAKQLAQEGFGQETSLIIEKPFGYDFKSSQKLNSEITAHFNESQIFRIDHYLAKEAVQNILVFRFANSLFYPVWNSRYIESIQINAFEKIGVENRGAYFDQAGIIRDMVQNHLTQLLCLLTMEAPVSLNAEDIRIQKINVLKTLRITDCCRFQYNGYRTEKSVQNDSRTETYAEIRLFIENFRWIGTPVYIRSGKALSRQGTEIGIVFKSIPRLLFNKHGNISRNKIIFKIQPTAGIIVDISSKVPGGELEITNTNMAFCYHNSFNSEIPEAYQRLLYDALKGDKTLFVSADETEIAWKKFEPILDKGEPEFYDKGSVPKLCLSGNWIDFEKYKSICE